MIRTSAFLCLLAMAWIGCDSHPARFGPGLHQQVRVAQAQLLEGPLADDQGGPEVSQVLRQQSIVTRGDGTVILSGRLGAGGVALHIQAEGDVDHWVLGASGFDFVVADELRYAAQLEFAHSIVGDELRLRLQAADAEGRLGPITQTNFVISDDIPAAKLLVSMAWDAPVDLDLAVMDANGVVIGAKNVNSYQSTPGLPPSEEWKNGGFLLFDSNPQCQLDLRNREYVMWLDGEPPKGRYSVYAQLFASCGQPSVNILSTVHLNGTLIESGAATQYAFDSRIHPSGEEVPGLLMMEFDVP